MNRVDAAIVAVFFAFLLGCVVGAIGRGDIVESQWEQGIRRVTPDHKVEEWHAPLKPGDAGWWEVVK